MTPARENEPRSSVWFIFAAVVAGLGAAFFLWGSWCAFPDSNWNEMRLAPAFALRYGITLYPLVGDGPLSTWIYGPVGAAINLPATLADSPAHAIAVAGVINSLTLILPFALICGSDSSHRPPGLALRALVFALCILSLPSLCLIFQVADHAAAALGLLSTWILTRHRSPGTARIGWAAGLCVLAAWSKQTSALLAVAHILGLLAMRERGAALRYAIIVVGLAAATLGVTSISFGFDNLWLNLVEIPARLPWGDIGDKLDRRGGDFVIYVVIVPILALATARYAPPQDPATARLLRFALIAYTVFLPAGLAAFFKIGGDMNSLHAWYFLLPALVIAWVGYAQNHPARALGPIIVTTLLLALRFPYFLSLPSTPANGKIRFAERFARANPETLWFPYNPVITFYSDNKLYHVEDGLATRHLAGLPLREQAFHRSLPSRLTAVIYPVVQTHRFSLQLIPAFRARTVLGEWAVFTKIPTP
ncbi:MAG: DUF2029 domain-containing protein [Undibacterium sp.]|nr:DUF2029 domain-containing protein [Opitutaceae bacterium]